MNASAQVQRRQKPHVVVVGGGFAGLSAVRALRHVDVDVTLIDRHPYNTFYPLLYQVATATLNPGDITYFLRAVRARQKNMRFVNEIGRASCRERVRNSEVGERGDT